MNQNKLVAVVCGMPFSGTTYLSRIITSHALINSGFECGLLFGNAPQDFPVKAEKFYGWMMSNEAPYNWNLNKKQMDDVCSQSKFYDAYSKIVEHCELFVGEKRYVLDKTPAYVYNLTHIMRKVPETPFIVVSKNIYYQYYSYKKRGVGLAEFCDLYRNYKDSILKVSGLPLRKRILNVEFKNLIKCQGKSYTQIFKHISKFNSEISFSKALYPEMKVKLTEDIDSKKKKLRKAYNIDSEIKSCKESLTEMEIKILDDVLLQYDSKQSVL